MKARTVGIVAVLIAALVPGSAVSQGDVFEENRGTIVEARHKAQHPPAGKLDTLETAGITMPFEGVVGTETPREVQLYFHASAPVATVDALEEFSGGAGRPYMDENAPTNAHPKIAHSMIVGNRDFRKNFLLAYWAGAIHGVVKDPSVTVWMQSSHAVQLEVSLFGDGGIGVATPLARRTLNLPPAAAPVEVTVSFAPIELSIHEELVVQLAGRTAVGNADAQILFDATTFASGLAMTLSQLPSVPRLDDPAGIAFRGDELVVANAGSGHLVVVENGEPSSVLLGGVIPGGFARGLTGVAVDADHTVYAAIAETGEIVYVTADGTRGVYARDLGAPVGIAFSADGNLYVADAAGRRVLSIAPDGIVTIVAQGLSGTPYGLAVAPDGTLAVSTLRTGEVHRIDPATGEVDLLVSLGNGHSAEGLAFAASGALYVGDGAKGQVVLVIGDAAGAIDPTGLGGPLHLAFDPTQPGVLVVASQGVGAADRIVRIDVGEAGAPLHAPVLSPEPVQPSARTWVHRAGGIAVDRAEAGSALPEATMRLVGRDAAEPTMGIQRDGDLFYVAATFDSPLAPGLAARSEVFRSRDSGDTWAEITPQQHGTDMPPATVDPYVWVDPATDRVYTMDLTSACTYLSYSDDDGETWTQNPLACGVPPVDHQTLAGGPPRTVSTEYPTVLYLCSNWVAVSPCSRSFDGGDTWVPGGIAYIGADVDDQNQPGQCGGLTAHVVTDPEGRVFLPRGHCGRPFVSISEDDGTTWRTVAVSSTVRSITHETGIAADADGNLYYVWIGTDRLPYLSVSTDHGSTWGAPMMVAPPGVTETNLATITAGDTGAVAISYMGTTGDYGYGTRDVTKLSWNGYVTVVTDLVDVDRNVAADPLFLTTTANPLTDPLYRGACGPGRCGNVFDFLDVVIGPDGRTWATFVDACTGPCTLSRGAASTDGEGVVAPLRVGPKLRGAGALDPLE